MENFGRIVFLAGALAVIAAPVAEARGRTGSHRIGGYNSHGKGSHYYGGHTELLVPPTIRLATECSDGSYSGSSGRGTCSHHGGEAGNGG